MPSGGFFHGGQRHGMAGTKGAAMRRPLFWAMTLVPLLVAIVLAWRGWGGEGDAGPGSPVDHAASGLQAATPSAPVVMPPPVADAASAVSPAGLMADYRDSGGRSHAKHAGKRLGLQGTVTAVETGQGGLVMLSLDAGPDLPPARAVMAASDTARVRDWQAGRAVVLDCANQGLLMGEPLLADCRAVKD